MLRVVTIIFVLVSALLTPLVTPPVATASASVIESAPPPWGSATPTLLVSPLTGEVHAVWVEEGEYTVIRHSVELAIGVWTGETYPVAYGDAPDTEFTPDGTLHMVFENQFMENWEVYYVKLAVGAERWTPPVPVSRTTGESRNPRMSIAPDGIIHTTWQDRTPGYWVVYKGRLCNTDLMFFCNYPLENGRGFGPDVLADGQGQWFVWQDAKYYDVGNYILVHFPGVELAVVVHETDRPVNNLRLVPRTLPGGGVRIRWTDADGEEWFCDGWLHPQTGEIQLGYVLPWPPEPVSHSIFLPFVMR